MGRRCCLRQQRKRHPQNNVGAAKLLRDWGIEERAHGGRWHRQVSLLSFEKTEDSAKKARRFLTARLERIY